MYRFVLFNVSILMLATVVLSALAAATRPPVGVSPGGPEGAVISDPCPTFSWGAEGRADSYELVVYRIDEHDKDATPVLVLNEVIAGLASSWTPSLDRCLERGRRYAWSVRSQGSDWSQLNLFDLPSKPSEAEFQAALQVVRRYLDAQAVAIDAGAGAEEVRRSDAKPRNKSKKPPASPEVKSLTSTLFMVGGGALVAGDLQIGGNLLSDGDICIGNCP